VASKEKRVNKEDMPSDSLVLLSLCILAIIPCTFLWMLVFIRFLRVVTSIILSKDVDGESVEMLQTHEKAGPVTIAVDLPMKI